MYDTKIGQFLSEDPLAFDAGDANLRRYVLNQPTMLIDPDGKAAQAPTLLAQQTKAPIDTPKPPTSATLDLTKHYQPKPPGTQGMKSGALTAWKFVPLAYNKKGTTTPAGGSKKWTFTIQNYSTQAVYNAMGSFYISGTDLTDKTLKDHEVMHLKMAEQMAEMFSKYMQTKVFEVTAANDTKLKEMGAKAIEEVEKKFEAWAQSFQDSDYHNYVLDPKTKQIDPVKQKAWEKMYEKKMKEAFDKAFPPTK